MIVVHDLPRGALRFLGRHAYQPQEPDFAHEPRQGDGGSPKRCCLAPTRPAAP